jgi:hypothetical protein
MYDKYMKRLSESNDMNKVNDEFGIMFMFELRNAWEMPIESIIITNDSHNNVYCINEKHEKSYTINTDKIIEIIKKYSNDLSKIDETKLPNPGVMDGYINCFSFKTNKWYDYKFYNLGFYEDEEIDNSKELSTIFSFLNELYGEFKKQEEDITNYFELVEEEYEFD